MKVSTRQREGITVIELVKVHTEKDLQHPDLVERFRANHDRLPCGTSATILALHRGRAPVALVVLGWWKDDPPHLILYELFVTATQRNKGIGSRALEASEALARRGGMAAIRLQPDPLDTTVSPPRLLAWYEGRGYSFLDGSNTVMEKRLTLAP